MNEVICIARSGRWNEIRAEAEQRVWSRLWEKRVLLRVCRPLLVEMGGLRRKDWECFSAA